MRVAVTGGSGFIGAHVVDRLLDAGHEVRALDLDVSNADPRADGQAVDVLDLDAVVAALDGCDAVFHIAGMSNVDIAFADPVGTVRLNVEGTGNVCEAARRCGLRRVLFASTVWVYGAVPETPGDAPDGRAGADTGADRGQGRGLTEDAFIELDRAGHVYTSTKLAAELLLHSYRETYGLPFTILRYGIPYGPGMRDELVLARFVARALAGEPLTVAGDGQQFRRYVYVRDLADAHVRALTTPAAENATIALEGAERVSVLDMAEAVRAHFPDIKIEHVPARPGDYRGREVSAELAARLLDWRPTTVFRDGVRQYIEWYRGNREDGVAPASAARPPASRPRPSATVPAAASGKPAAEQGGKEAAPSARSTGVPAASGER
ncbi:MULTISPECIES: NAD(P)-dependent oxidoreductase [unclassified Pseudofrankia]|uniref:NAD-dependent epimerase/dehydratase family protein n=1 Tax=unclassified Pseudofrankia TaxID=2994372 RepID=UPI0008DA664F|nr:MULTISPECIES: NAD-dependent epimerase/dehydratase family protein [unclassified Pseudofrankia]MDT3439787.1 NAD-dependent epimerase/dehydratase family protein [Pseudofrankia sp. BMG5.37]OHV44836.1 epimerase [Pseudofrankia sp. BMG5.36]